MTETRIWGTQGPSPLHQGRFSKWLPGLSPCPDVKPGHPLPRYATTTHMPTPVLRTRANLYPQKESVFCSQRFVESISVSSKHCIYSHT